MIPTLSKITQRVIAVDEELGDAAVRMNFGPGSTFEGGGELDVWHSFKTYGVQIKAAEAYCEIVPAGTKYGWEYFFSEAAGSRDNRQPSVHRPQLCGVDKAAIPTKPAFMRNSASEIGILDGESI
jgi:hypothetical protein